MQPSIMPAVPPDMFSFPIGPSMSMSGTTAPVMPSPSKDKGMRRRVLQAHIAYMPFSNNGPLQMSVTS